MKRKPHPQSLQIVTPPRSPSRCFRTIAEQYFEETFRRFPVLASQLGRAEFNGLLGKPNPAAFRSQRHLTESTLAAIENIPASDFSPDDWLDRRAMLAELRRNQLELGPLARWQNNPEQHASVAIGSIHHLVVRHADNLRDVLPAIESRLRQLPAFLAEAAATVRNPVPLWVKLAQQTCGGAPGFFQSLIDPCTAAGPKPRAHWQKLLTDAGRAFPRFAEDVAAKPAGPRNGYCIGRERFEFLIRERLGLPFTAREAEAVARQLVTGLNSEMAREARKFSSRKSVAEILDQAARDWRPRESDLLAEYLRVTGEVKEKFQAARAMSFPIGDQLLVKPVPDFLRHQFPTAAYNSPGPFEKKQIGIFWVNDLSLVQKTAEGRAREIRQHFGIELTAAHEAYPGHHLQFVTQNRHPSRLRRLFAHSIYYEGWTLWVEQMTVDLRVTRHPYARLAQLHDALWRAHRILVDCGLQTGTMEYDDACRHLQRHVGFTSARARGDVNWYTASPTVPMSYLLGKWELLRLKRQRVDKGGWSLKRFNDWVLSFGALPWSWIETSGL